ncbi:MAG: hypothetical protein ABSH20_03160 [Tepidisphaeraceae bacterium]|jgi:hypothetical protein
MSQMLDFERDRFLELLTDALRCGPKSPQWKDAVEKVRSMGGADADDYQLLLRAREDLEAGLDYRSIRAGAGFTRKVMEQIEKEPGGGARPAIPAASAIAILAAAGILAVLVVVAVVLMRQPPLEPGVAELQNLTFPRTVLLADLGIGVPPELKTFGKAPVISAAAKGIRAAEATGAKDFVGGGVHLAEPLTAGDPLAIEVGLNQGKPSANLDLQVFVGESANFEGPKAMSARELVVDLREGQFAVYRPDGTMAGSLVKAAQGRNIVTLKLDARNVVIEANGATLYAGPHGLPAGGLRVPGVRFLARGGEKKLDELSVSKIRVLRP